MVGPSDPPRLIPQGEGVLESEGLDKGSGSPTASCWTLDKSLLLCLGEDPGSERPLSPAPPPPAPPLALLWASYLCGWNACISGLRASAFAEGFEAPSIKWRVEFPVPGSWVSLCDLLWPIGYQQTSLRQKLEARLPASTSPWVPLSLCEQGLSCWTEEGEEMFIHPSRTSHE